jgi:hydrogenase large subunit
VTEKVVVGPITRANNEGHIELRVEGGKVVDCRSSALFFRGFEMMLEGRDPRDAPYFTERICGICSSAHATAAAFALENLAGVVPPKNGNLLRNLIFGADILQNHVRHFYMLALPDYVRGPERPPFVPRYKHGYRLTPEVEGRFITHYFEAVNISRIAHELVTTLGGKAPFPHGIVAGGATVPPDAAVILDLRAKLSVIARFIKEKMTPDAQIIAESYPEYFRLGRRPQRLLVIGAFPKEPERKTFHWPGGVVENGTMANFKIDPVTEHVRHSYFEDRPGTEPLDAPVPKPRPVKPGAYTWTMAPRYQGKAFEVGPLARLWVLGRYRRGVSAMDRLIARVTECGHLCELMRQWIDELAPDEPVFTRFETPEEGEAYGLTGAMRGALLHYLRLEKGRISRYRIITPSAWNFSPRDDAGRPGPVEEALLGTPIADPKEPIEVGRIVRSFDPCYSCATHIIVRSSS